MKCFKYKRILVLSLILIIFAVVFIGYNKTTFGVLSRKTNLLSEYQSWESKLA